jgi:hypothetical protein
VTAYAVIRRAQKSFANIGRLAFRNDLEPDPSLMYAETGHRRRKKPNEHADLP